MLKICHKNHRYIKKDKDQLLQSFLGQKHLKEISKTICLPQFLCELLSNKAPPRPHTPLTPLAFCPFTFSGNPPLPLALSTATLAPVKDDHNRAPALKNKIIKQIPSVSISLEFSTFQHQIRVESSPCHLVQLFRNVAIPIFHSISLGVENCADTFAGSGKLRFVYYE